MELRKNYFRTYILLFIMLTVYKTQAQSITVKFTVDMQYQISNGLFNTATDNVYLRGSFNTWSLSNRMTHSGNGEYTITLSLNSNSFYDYKYYTDAPGFPNGGYEKSVGVANENRWMGLGTNNVELAKIYFNNANLHAGKITDHFVLYCADSDDQNMDRISSYLEDNLMRITNALESTVGQKVNIWIYPDQKTYFVHKGYPDSPSWSIGGAVGKTDVLLFSPTYMGWETLLSTALHEFTHIVVAWKIAGTVPSWLNEGCALILSDDPPSRPLDSIRDIVNRILGGAKPTLEYIEQPSFGDGNGYPLSHTTVDFILTTFGSHKLAEFLVNTDYSILGFSSKSDFQNSWHNFLDKYYLAQQVKLKFYVDMSYYIYKGWFNPSTDNVKIGGTFSGWYPYGTINEGNGIYSFPIFSPLNIDYQYKFKISTAGEANEGWETNSRSLNVIDAPITTPLRPFNNLDDRITIIKPGGGEYLIAGDSVDIKWKYTSVPQVKIEFSADNGSTWSTIENQFSAPLYSYKWLVPFIAANQAKIKISNVSDNSVFDISTNAFKIVKSATGGPYVKDQNTLLLMHFENNYDNTVSANFGGTAHNTLSFVISGMPDLNKALYIDNSLGGSCVSIPDHPAINLSGSWTIECWFYINNCGSGNTAYPTFLLKGDYPSDYSITFSSDGKSINAYYGNASGGIKNVNCSQLSTKTWYHLSFVRNTSSRKLSLTIRNTEKQIVSSASINDDGSPKSTNSDLLIGGVAVGSNIQFDGYIDELRISNSARDFLVGIDEKYGEKIPASFTLEQNYPNPFNPSTTIKFSLPAVGGSSLMNVSLRVFDLLGREIAVLINEARPAGNYTVRFDAKDLPSGIYFYQLNAGNFSSCKKLLLIK